MKKLIGSIVVFLFVVTTSTYAQSFSVSQHDSLRLTVNADASVITVIAKKDAKTFSLPDSIVQLELLVAFSDSADKWGAFKSTQPILQIGDDIMLTVAPRSGDMRIPRRQVLCTFKSFTVRRQNDWYVFTIKPTPVAKKVFVGIKDKDTEPELLSIQ